MTKIRAILHSDINAFYASVEQVLDPSLKNKKIAVSGSEDARHGIILAKSEEAKKCGVKTGMQNFVARNLCRDIIFIEPKFEEYLKYSKLVRNIYLRYTDQVESYGMDECWLDVTSSVKLHGSAYEIAKKISSDCKREIGLTVSIGVSYNKIFAKLGSDMKKPDAITVIPRTRFKEMIWHLDASNLLFVGKKTREKLAYKGIYTIGDIARAESSQLEEILGKNGLKLKTYALGKDESAVNRADYSPEFKSISSGTTLPNDIEEKESLWKLILYLCQNLSEKLARHSVYAKKVSFSVRWNDFSSNSHSSKISKETRSSYSLAQKIMRLFSKKCTFSKPLRAFTVSVSDFTKTKSPTQLKLNEDLSFFDRHEREEKIDGILREIHSKYGKNSLKRARLLDLNELELKEKIDIIMPRL